MNQLLFAGSLAWLFSSPAFAAPTDAYTQRDVMQCGGVEVVLVSSCRSVTVDGAQTHVIPVCSDQTINIGGKVLRRDISKVSQLTSDGYYSTSGRLEQYSFDNNQRSFGSKGSREELIKAYGVTKRQLMSESPAVKRIVYGQP